MGASGLGLMSLTRLDVREDTLLPTPLEVTNQGCKLNTEKTSIAAVDPRHLKLEVAD